MVKTAILDKLDRWLATNQPELHVEAHEGQCRVFGQYQLEENEESNLTTFASFDIEMIFPVKFPVRLPVVYETDKQIERLSENHINFDGSICYGVPEIISALRPNLTIAEFFEEILFDYFLGYLHFKETGQWPYGELSHGIKGIYQGFSDILGCENSPKIIYGLLYLLTHKHRRDRWACPCKSGKRLRDCCRPALNVAGRRVKRQDAKRLLSFVKAVSIEERLQEEHERNIALEEQASLTELSSQIKGALTRCHKKMSGNEERVYSFRSYILSRPLPNLSVKVPYYKISFEEICSNIKEPVLFAGV